MSNQFSKVGRLAATVSLPVLMIAFNAGSAWADYKSYTPTLASSAYQINFAPSSDSDYNMISYEQNSAGDWEKLYYKYSYTITACGGTPCSSNNRISADQAGRDVSGSFYGLTKSAIDNSNHKIGKLTGDFLNNTGSRGGAIVNREEYGRQAIIGSIEGDFINNHADIYGGAIMNQANTAGEGASVARIGAIKGNFIGNSSGSLGGAIYNYSNGSEKIAEIESIEGDFIANTAQDGWGGAIYNDGTIGNITGDFIYNNAEDGGAIMNTEKMGDVTGRFIANNGTGSGGALYLSNYSEIGKITADFIGNTAALLGGAIINTNAKEFNVTGNFIENQAKYGGAIYNSSYETGIFPAHATITNSSFFNNRAEEYGGAIFHEGTLDIVADNYDSVFKGNQAAGVSNAIYISNDDEISDLNLIASNNGSITFYDDIDGDEGYRLNLDGDASGHINFHANINNGDIIVGTDTITLAAADPVNVSFDDISNISNRNNSLIVNDGVLNFDDFALTQHQFRELKFTGGEININHVDVDLENTVMGRFIADANSGGSTTVNVHNLDILSDGGGYTAVDFADIAFAGQVQNNVTAATGPVYDYTVSYRPDSGQFVFQRATVNNEVQLPSYAAVAAVSVLSDEIYSRVLSDADSYFKADPAQSGFKPMVKVFGADDNIDIKHFAGGHNKFYGLIAGAESTPYALGDGWNAVYNAYLAYAKGEHKYASERVNQESGYVGASAIVYRDQFFAGATINTAVVENKAKEFDGKNDFTSYLGGIGIKTGYNIDLGSDLLLQPNLYGSYTYIKSHDYKTKRGAVVKFDDMANYELAPGLKLAKKFAEGLSVYAQGRYVFVFNDGQDAKANQILLPELELKNYAEFGLGVEKTLVEKNMDLYLEISRREGGREGWNGIAGAKWSF